MPAVSAVGWFDATVTEQEKAPPNTIGGAGI